MLVGKLYANRLELRLDRFKVAFRFPPDVQLRRDTSFKHTIEHERFDPAESSDLSEWASGLLRRIVSGGAGEVRSEIGAVFRELAVARITILIHSFAKGDVITDDRTHELRQIHHRRSGNDINRRSPSFMRSAYIRPFAS